MTKEKSTTNKSSKNAAAELGRLGGKAVLKKYGKGYMSEMGKRSAEVRWSKKAKKN